MIFIVCSLVIFCIVGMGIVRVFWVFACALMGVFWVALFGI